MKANQVCRFRFINKIDLNSKRKISISSTVSPSNFEEILFQDLSILAGKISSLKQSQQLFQRDSLMNQEPSPVLFDRIGQLIKLAEEKVSKILSHLLGLSSKDSSDSNSDQLYQDVTWLEKHIKKIKGLFETLISSEAKNAEEEEEEDSIGFAQIEQEIEWINTRLNNLQSFYTIDTTDVIESPFYFLELERLNQNTQETA